jgi:hypothetical protein
MGRSHFAPDGGLSSAARFSDRATGMKRAACGRMDRRRQVAPQNGARALRSRFELRHSRD